MQQNEARKKQQWLARLKKIEAAAKGGPLKRLAYAPLSYLSGVGHHRLAYTFSNRTWKRRTRTFFDTQMTLLLPAGLDIYLLDAKTHESEIRLARFMIHHIKPGDTVMDIGAHFGFFALLGAKLTGENGKVLAIEATSTTYEILKENLHGTDQAEPLHAAASDQSGILTFYEFPPLYSEYNTTDEAQYQLAVRESGTRGRAVEVPSVVMDALIAERSLQPDFIKLDVEGAEALVLKGLKSWLEQGSGTLAMEYLSPKRQNEQHRIAADFLQAAGWQPYRILPDGQLEACPDIEGYLKQAELDSDNLIFQSL